MEPSHLRPDELQYELKLRGIPEEGSLEQRLNVLKDALSKETDSETTSQEYPFDPNEQLSIIGRKVEQLSGCVEDVFDDRSAIRVQSRLRHLINRLAIIPETAQLSDEVNAMHVKLSFLVSVLGEKLATFKSAPVVNESTFQDSCSPNVEPKTRLSQSSPTQAASGSRDHQVTFAEYSRIAQSPLVGVPTGAFSEMLNRSEFPTGNCYVPPQRPTGVPYAVSKWGVTFDGKSPGILSFIERVEELALARNVSSGELFRQSLDLFKGDALMWFRRVRPSVSSWEELRVRLRRSFLDPDYEICLEAEIAARTQGCDEPAEIYISLMERLFVRLSSNIPEETRVRKILRNMLPYYQERLLGNTPITIEQLADECRLLESTKRRLEQFKPPPSVSRSTVEPECAYRSSLSGRNRESHPKVCVETVRPVETKVSPKGDTQPRVNVKPNTSVRRTPPTEVARPMVCFNCRKPGHSVRECPDPRRIVCYGCGTPNVYRSQCNKCNPKNV